MDARPGVLHPFHRANIHEKRLAAKLARAAPIGSLVFTTLIIILGVWKFKSLLLALCAVLNVSMWMWIVSTAIFGIMGSYTVAELLGHYEMLERTGQLNDSTSSQGRHPETVVYHAVVLPNYKEEEAMLAETLEALSEAKGSRDLLVVLAMEEREGDEAKLKAAKLQVRFRSHFYDLIATFHPPDLEEQHLDGSVDQEVPGKASNLKWAVTKAYETCMNDPVFSRNLANVVVTVADADCLLHPCYFHHVTEECKTMMEVPGEQHRWTMWQAPQLPYRNYYPSPAPARIWGYVSSLYEFGGVSSLSSGGHHMVFSAYSVNLQLAIDAMLWDGDVIAEDHHAFLKCYFYSAHLSAQECLYAEKEGKSHSGCRPKLRVRPVMLPVKSTSVISNDGYWASWVERWNQAKRHCQGVAEMSYAILVAWHLLKTVPRRFYNFHFVSQLIRVVFRPVLIHIIPICQFMALAVLTIFWLFHGMEVPQCPTSIILASADGKTLLCGLAGAWVLTWPVVIPFCLVATCNFRFLKSTFIEPSQKRRAQQEAAGPLTKWDSSDGELIETLGSKSYTCLWLIALDCIFLVGPLMVPYGLLAELNGCWNVLLRGNHFKYITASKKMQSYGSVEKADISAAGSASA